MPALRPTARSTTLLAAAGVVFVASVAVLFVGVWKLFALRAEAHAAHATALQNAEKAAGFHVDAALASRTKIARAELFRLAIVRDGGVAAFISKLEALAAQARTRISIGSVSATAPSGGTPGNLALSVQITGSYSDCMRFLQLLETLPAALSLGSVTLSHNDAAQTWSMSLTLSVLSYDSP